MPCNAAEGRYKPPDPASEKEEKLMIVKITNESKKWMTVYELEQAKIIIQQFKEDNSMADLCQIAAKVASKTIYKFEIFKSVAEIAGNSRIRDAYHDGSGKLDVWIECYAYNPYIGFFTIGAYYTDLIKHDGTEEMNGLIRDHMYIREFKEI